MQLTDIRPCFIIENGSSKGRCCDCICFWIQVSNLTIGKVYPPLLVAMFCFWCRVLGLVSDGLWAWQQDVIYFPQSLWRVTISTSTEQMFMLFNNRSISQVCFSLCKIPIAIILHRRGRHFSRINHYFVSKPFSHVYHIQRRARTLCSTVPVLTYCHCSPAQSRGHLMTRLS